jgi:hypothetical protein
MKYENLSFSRALELLKVGARLQRDGWNGKGMWIEVQWPDANSKMTLPYLFLNYPTDVSTGLGTRVPWLASQTDLMAEDWRRV